MVNADGDGRAKWEEGDGTAGDPAAATTRCGFCGDRFEEDRAQPACRRCPLGSACGHVRCPLCGYENPVTPAWLQSLRAAFGRLTRPAPAAGEEPR